jgi:excisionase family DNA binding protein
MTYTLGTAAKATGVSKSTIYRAVRDGRLSAARTDTGDYSIDPAELHRVYPPLAGDPEPPPMANGMAVLEERLAARDAMLSELRSQLDDVKVDRDRWRAHAEGILRQLPAPTTPAATPRRSWWRPGRVLGVRNG